MVVWDEVFEKCCTDPAKATRIREISHRGWTKHGRGCVLVYQEVQTRPRGAGTGFTSKPSKSSLRVPDFVPLDWYAVYLPREFLLDPRKAPVETQTMSHDARPNVDATVDVGHEAKTQHNDSYDINVNVEDDNDAHDTHLLVFDEAETQHDGGGDIYMDDDNDAHDTHLLIFDDDDLDVTADDDDANGAPLLIFDDEHDVTAAADDTYDPPLLIFDDDENEVSTVSLEETRHDEDDVAHSAYLYDAMDVETHEDGASDAARCALVGDVTMKMEVEYDKDDVSDAAHAAPFLGVTVNAETPLVDKDDIPDSAHGTSGFEVTGEAETHSDEGAPANAHGVSVVDVTVEAERELGEVGHADAHGTFIGDVYVGMHKQSHEVDANGSVANHEKVAQVGEGMQNQDDLPSEADDVQLISQQMLFSSMRGMDVTRLLSLTTNFDFEADNFRLGSKTAMIDTKTMDAGGEDPYNPTQDELVLLLHLVIDGRPAFGADVVIAYRHETNIVGVEEKDSWKLRLKYKI